ncbi:MAG: peptide chain release factor N(5)-glutamine methyltransferase [Clostridium argentinense]|uniref:Release factor glutamine methyltransferase n=1 Tax=Clostridium faecium TaxID=2762223 RepID=A0ABR8YRZ5_9CLOT|nr:MULTISPECIES: peptide chain release factor N(5)-glutamine methyltransferase [Clostridium]MBD8047020.1 peptide chain release factor N(5)-glutamine methyltransferase [Clostridium faecium]MBS5823281.1 peptide chain release factor N(5)-glutamine methyltransferase [Clostridium argentinense]MDU1349626.1 peptide chain release factor N(5)-glutamine methyltransferase [Clostridium argentinense]
MKIATLLTKGYEILKDNQIESYIIDTNLLLCHVLKVEKLYIMMNRDVEVSKEDEEKFFSLIKLRSEKMPIKYILGSSEFMGLNFSVKEGVLIPRPDTEILVEECIKIIKKNNLKYVCDVCTGSGAIGISIAHYINDSNVTLYDISNEALEITEKNIEKLGVREQCRVYYSNLLSKAIEEKKIFDMVVSNPPYIRKEEIKTLMEDVKNYEPHLALDGGEDGLEFYRKITLESKYILKKRGYLAFEIGHDQREAVIKILEENKFTNIYSLKDLYQNDRVVIGQIL